MDLRQNFLEILETSSIIESSMSESNSIIESRRNYLQFKPKSHPLAPIYRELWPLKVDIF